MGFYNSPRIVTDNLVLNLDAGNIKSYAGDVPTPAGTSYGYFGGGYGGSPAANLTTVSRIDFDNDTATAVAKGPLSNDGFPKASAGSFSYGYFSGGETSPGSYPTSTLRLDYSSDTSTTAVKGPLSAVNRRSHAAVGNNSYGYHCAGPGISSVDRIDYSNDTAAASPKGPLSAAKWYLCATGNQSYGYIGGGHPGPYSTVDRIDYSSDTPTASPKGPLSVARYNGGATGNASYGYFGGGNPGPKSTIDRLDYSSDTTAAAVKGPLAAARSYVKATGNTSYGYWGGGSPGLSTVERVDYGNDTATASPKGSLSVGSSDASGVSSRANANPTSSGTQTRTATQTAGTAYGYIGGGQPGPRSDVERIDYGNDTATASPKGPLGTARTRNLAATSNQPYGYFGGGASTGGSPLFSTVDRVDYSNDTATAAEKGPLVSARYRYYATGNTSYGYWGGGDPGAVSSVDRVDYSSDTSTATPKGPLSGGKKRAAATGTTSYGYWSGGEPGPISTTDRIDYSSDTSTASPKSPLTQKRTWMGATGNGDYGYFGGGKWFSQYSIVDRIDYSSDTPTMVAKGPLSSAKSSTGATGSSSYGYWAAGTNPSPGPMSTVDRLDYSSDTTTAAAKGPLTATRYWHTATSSRINGFPTTSTSYPWYDTSGKGDDGENTSGGATFSSAGGGSFTFNGTSNYVSSDDKVNLQLGSGNFTLAAWIKPANGAATNYGYFAGGYAPPNRVSTVDRIDYSNDTPAAVEKGPLSVGRQLVTGTGNVSYGYFAGGSNPAFPGATSIVDRFDYSNDTATTPTKGPLSLAKYTMGGAGNASYGWFGGGNTGSPAWTNLTTVDRVDYSNDTATAAVRGPLSDGRRNLAATGNTSYGYFGGGTPSVVSTVDRIDYSSDTGTTPTKGPLSSARYYLAATGNASYGYFSGGSPSPISSIVDRIDYGNDTATAAEKGPLASARNTMGATGNTSYGYFAGGASLSTVERLDYSSDTTTAAAKGPLSLARRFLAAASPKANALVGRSDNEGIISYSDSSGEENDTTCQLDTNSDGKIKFTGAAGIVTSTSAVAADTWSHAAVTRTDNTISVYVNGVLENTGITTHTFSDYATVTIGANRPRSTFYKGDISQVQIYKKSLSSDEIQQNFRSVKKRFGL